MALVSPYQSNSKGNPPAQDVGIKISIPGTNALTASPTQLIFDSSWPSVAVAFSYIGTLPSTNQTIAVPHNLGFPPFPKVWLLDSSGNILKNSAVLTSLFGVDSTNFYLYDNTSPVIPGTSFYVNLYNIDLSKDIDYPTLDTTSQTEFYDPNYGIKIAKSNKVVSSTDGRDFVLHSRFRSPLIKAVKTQATSVSSGVVQYVNSDGAATWNFGFVKTSTGAYNYAPYYAQAYPKTSTDGITTYLPWTGTDVGATLVILRDPFFAPNIIQAVY